MPLGKLNDSNPTRHGLAPALVPGTYTADPRGPRPAREALASFLTELHRGAEGAGTAPAADPNRLYLLSSTSQAYSWLMKLLCDAGDAVLAPKPGYPLIESIARLECVDTIEYQLRFDGSWYIDVAELRALLDGPQGARIRAPCGPSSSARNSATSMYHDPSKRSWYSIVSTHSRRAMDSISGYPGLGASTASPASHSSFMSHEYACDVELSR